MTIQQVKAKRRNAPTVWAGLAALLVGAAVIAGVPFALGDLGGGQPASQGTSAPTTFEAHGTLTLIAGGIDGGPCSGDGGYSDISDGTQVTVYNSNSQPIALGALQPGAAHDYNCVFEFSVPNVPDDGNIYSIEVSHRGKIQFTKDNASNIALTLGG